MLSKRRKQMLAWYKTMSKTKVIEDEFEYKRWSLGVGGKNMLDSIAIASEDQLDDLYILREELRLGI